MPGRLLGYHRAVGPTKAEVLELLAAHARLPGDSGKVPLGTAYLRAVERWEDMPENAEGADKSWVDRSRRSFEEHFRKARAGA
jgi:hypothetical protein